MTDKEWPQLPYTDLRTFIKFLESKSLLRYIKRPVSREFEISAGIRKISDEEGPALLFENVHGFDIPVVGGLFATKALSLAAMGVDDYDAAVARFGYGVENPLPPQVAKQGPCQEVVLQGDEIDVSSLPHPIYSHGDSGPYIASGIVITRDPDDEIPNAGIYRMEVKGPRTLCLEAPNYQHVNIARIKAESRGEPLDVAVAIGTDPLIYYASQAKVGSPW